MNEKRICGDCAKYLTYDCPRCEYKDIKLNRAACLPTDSACEQFQKTKNEKPKPTHKNSTKENKVYPNCEDLIFDQRGQAICIANLEFPAYCTPENCPKRIAK